MYMTSSWNSESASASGSGRILRSRLKLKNDKTMRTLAGLLDLRKSKKRQPER